MPSSEPFETTIATFSILAERADRRGAPAGEVALPHEADDEPVTVRELGDPVQCGDRLGDLLVPLRGVGQEAFAVDVDRRVGDQGGGHAVLLPQACTGARFLPAVGLAAPAP